ncbi:pantoate--beta-alanine ligase [bacterium]|nr:pantoate--beta-alanine ligase [bacterium]
MDVVESIADVRRWVRNAKSSGKTVGFIPTMGALHDGHLSLIEAAKRQHAAIVVSIFVNPTQFAPHEDLQRYPRPRERDLELCRNAGAGLVFYPAVETMYPPGSSTFVEVKGLTDRWEGAIRPGHFLGVTTVVNKLFQIVQPNAAYFGQKDYQQQAVIKRMVRDLDMPLEIVTCPTMRDADGLAMSSRNAYLSADQRRAGLCLSRALAEGKKLWHRGTEPQEISQVLQQQIGAEPEVHLDYATVADVDTLEPLESRGMMAVALVACRVGSTRLIDNDLWQS